MRGTRTKPPQRADLIRALIACCARPCNRDKAGTVSYHDVATAQTTAPANARTAMNLLGQRLVASAQLIASLGRGWTPKHIAPMANANDDRSRL